MQDIFDFAMQMETDGMAFYKRAAGQAAIPQLKEIFLYLAEEESRHYRFFKELKEGNAVVADKELQRPSGQLSAARNVFSQLIEESRTKSFGEDACSVWKEALSIEERAVKLYAEEAEKETDPERKVLLKRIADEERSHVYLIDNVLSFMNDPATFSESRKFADFKSWEGH